MTRRIILWLLTVPVLVLLLRMEGRPEPDRRFPPLQVPAGFQATLFASDPLIEYPSVIAAGPRPSTLYVAIDYMTGLGADIVRRDEIRLIEDTDGDGVADKAPVYAAGFNSIQGLAYHQGTVYVMHAPYLTALRDTTGDGQADERRELLTGLGLAPEVDQIRLHNANGVVPAHDGWLYLALGDRGCKVARPEGDTLVLEAGGILRCRLDGRDLHVFSTGLRNIYDVALDEDLTPYVRDNENDGGTYKIRVCRSFFGADHGYPYKYAERPAEALAPLADLGLGSAAGGVCYLEQQFPAEYRGNLFFCEWGRAVVRYPLDRTGNTFASHKEIDLAAGGANDPYGFKPTDIVVDADGSLFVSDWADGQRPRRGRGRIYRIQHQGVAGEKPAIVKDPDKADPIDKLVARLDAAGYRERRLSQEALEQRGAEGIVEAAVALAEKRLGVRGRLHAVWLTAKGPLPVPKLLTVVKTDPEPRVQAQAIRAVADLTDPMLQEHRLDAGPGSAKVADRLATLATGRDGRVMLEAIVALGRLRWAEAPDWLRQNLTSPDPTLAHAAQWTLRQSGNWPAILKLIDGPDSMPVRAIALRALAEQYEPVIVDGLIERLRQEPNGARRREYGDALTRVYKKPGPWTYWGFRPGPHPANTVAWERTDAIDTALNRLLEDADPGVRADVLQRMQREQVPAQTARLVRWLEKERDADRVAVILAAFKDQAAGEIREALEGVIRGKDHASANRLAAVSLYLQGLDAPSEQGLAKMAEAVEEGPVLAELLRGTGSRPKVAAGPLLVRGLKSADALVRACALDALADRGADEAREPGRQMLEDADARVRAAAARAAGKLLLKSALDALLKHAGDPDPEVRRACLAALQRLGDPRAVAVAVRALDDPETVLPALACLTDLGGPDQTTALTELARRQQSGDVLAAIGKALTGWTGRGGLSAPDRRKLGDALPDVHGSSGVLLVWNVWGPLTADAATRVESQLVAGPPQAGEDPSAAWRVVQASGLDARLSLGASKAADVWLGYTELTVPESARVDFSAANTGLATVWLNGQVVHERTKPGVIGPYPDRFEATLAKGRNRVLFRVSGTEGRAEFQLRFRRKSATADQERFALAALSRAGNPERGRQVFLNAEKSLCIKCHRVGDQGEKIGPELTGLGSRFAKVHIVESVLEPSRSIGPSFEPVAVLLKSGKLVTGLKVAETPATITLVDNQAQKHELKKTDIDEQQKQIVSIMPEGIEKRLSEDEFVDLISYLVNLKDTRPRQ